MRLTAILCLDLQIIPPIFGRGNCPVLKHIIGIARDLRTIFTQ